MSFSAFAAVCNVQNYELRGCGRCCGDLWCLFLPIVQSVRLSAAVAVRVAFWSACLAGGKRLYRERFPVAGLTIWYEVWC